MIVIVEKRFGESKMSLTTLCRLIERGGIGSIVIYFIFASPSVIRHALLSFTIPFFKNTSVTAVHPFIQVNYVRAKPNKDDRGCSLQMEISNGYNSYRIHLIRLLMLYFIATNFSGILLWILLPLVMLTGDSRE